MKLQKSLIGLVCLFTFCNGAFAQHAGSLDITFNPGSGPNGSVVSVALCTNSQVLIGGTFTSVNGQSRNYVARLNSDGSLDNGFLTGQGPNTVVLAVEADPNGGVYIGGAFGSYNGIPTSHFAKLRDDGSLDLSWNVAPDNEVNLIRRQMDGTFLVLGSFGHVNGVARKNIARLHSDGSFDGLFNPGAYVTDGTINAAAVQLDGSVIIAGSFTTNSPVSRQYIARVSDDGTLDPTFNAGYIGGVGGGVSIYAIASQLDGKLIVGGTFSSINGYSRLGIARLNTNGAVDTTFVPGTAAGTSFFGVTLLPDGSVLTSGATRLTTNGNYDATFAPQPNTGLNAVAIQPDGRILVAGGFTFIAGTNINDIARLIGTSTNSPGFQFLAANRYFGTFLSGTLSNTYRMEWTTNVNTPSLWTPLFNVTLQTNPQFILDTNPISGRQRFYRAVELP